MTSTGGVTVMPTVGSALRAIISSLQPANAILYFPSEEVACLTL